MKLLVATVSLFLGVQAAHAAVSCNPLPKACKVKELTYTVSEVSGDYKVTLRIPNLSNQSCSIVNDRAKVTFTTSSYAELSFAKSSKKATQKIAYSAIQCREDNSDGNATYFTLLGASKVLPAYNLSTVNLDYNKTGDNRILTSVTYWP